MTAQGNPRTIFKRAIENGNVAIAETTARELGRLSLDEALALTGLVVQKDRTSIRLHRSLAAPAPRGGQEPEDRGGSAGRVRASGAWWPRE
jgi:hypothetical protein